MSEQLISRTIEVMFTTKTEKAEIRVTRHSDGCFNLAIAEHDSTMSYDFKEELGDDTNVKAIISLLQAALDEQG